MKGFVEHLINSDTQVLDELELETLNESENVDDIINDDLDFEDGFANQEEPGELGDNFDGETNLGIDLDDLDESDEYVNDDAFFEQQDKLMQAYQGWNDDDLEDEALFEECLNQSGTKGHSGRKPDGVIKKAKKKISKMFGR